MKKILLLIALFFAIISWIQTNAFELKTWDQVYLTQEINNDLYVAWGSTDISFPVKWDLFIAWGDINVNSNISQDLIIFGWDISVSWTVWDDVRIWWWNIKISSNIDWDLIVWGWTVRVDKWVIIKWDLVVWAWRLIMDWEVLWNTKIAAWQLVLNWIIDWDADITLDSFSNISKAWVIKWKLKYTSNDKIQELEESSKSQILFEKSIIKEEVKKGFIWFISIFLILKIIWLFLFSILFYFYFHKYISDVSHNLKKNTWKSFLYWFLTIIWTPVIIILLFASVIWISFAFLLLFVYIFIFVFLGLINVIVFTSFFIDKYDIKELYKKLLIIFWLTLIFWLVNWINLIVWFFTLWAIVIKKIEIIEKLRKS